MTTYPSHKVAVISGRTNTVTTTIRAGSGLGEIAVNPKTGKAYVTGRGLPPGRDGLTRRSGLPSHPREARCAEGSGHSKR